MTREEIFNRVRKIIADETGIGEEDILWDSSIAELEESSSSSAYRCCKSQPK